VTSFGLTACSAVYYQVPHCRFLINYSHSIHILLFLGSEDQGNIFMGSKDKVCQVRLSLFGNTPSWISIFLLHSYTSQSQFDWMSLPKAVSNREDRSGWMGILF
jgi:hypothetical protein